MSVDSNQANIANRIYNTCIENGMPALLSQFIVGQSGNETGGWTSKFFTENNNCFGYSCDPNSDWQNGCSTSNADNGVQVGNYDNVEDSTMEVVSWINRRVSDGKFPSDLSTIATADQYAQLLQNSGYYTSNESSYAANIKKWLTNVGSMLTGAVNGNPVLLIGAGLLVIGGIWYGIKKGLFKK